MYNKAPSKNNQYKKFVTFTYHSTKVRKITNLFKQTDTRISFKSTNTIIQKTRRKPTTLTRTLKKVVYTKTCQKAYIGQTRWSLTPRFHEHTHYIKNTDAQSAYAQHILQNLLAYGTINDTMSLLQPVHTATMLLQYLQLFIQNYHHKGKLIPEQHRGEPNPLLQLAFDTCVTAHTWQTKAPYLSSS
jgi:hypothetical protein